MVLAGCAAAPPRAALERPAGSAVEGLPAAFELSGRIAVRREEQGFSGNLRWQHRPGRDEIWILSPLGQAAARITVQPGEARLDPAEGEAQQAPDAETLTERLLGWRLPLSGLQYWILGSNSPESPSVVEIDGEGHIARLVQDGWDIEFLRYADAGGRLLPKTLAVEREGLSIRLTVDEWILDVP